LTKQKENVIILGIMRLNIKKIQKEMKRRGWGYADLAKRLRVSRQAVWQNLHPPKRHNFNLKTIEKIAKALELDPKDLLV